mmetsp:Transcript_30486/g.55262  ORF Transcript_30486/g.55262 Transcript_30486/m.55262 type:complete len:90 (-) Transcript_30486:105-374(-)|eukprot:CAMPEP_0197622238 /NCGR_PEP_ID=MMETSP1338-20131121/2607_1 /TAXON_ID=43686 ORGANISM="Pelagodinium beii, Strain RCC1491" /NCGR_SAMPLE_ID=MMETSP1338 /ASSEMBLY_ACC=CAM_ASM_000754 /LENGTH=89 /DNA_ID=CAMNT_0043191931 /DNA_START=68 /DNA_END=337 /DNA_ORIENTATION=-
MASKAPVLVTGLLLAALVCMLRAVAFVSAPNALRGAASPAAAAAAVAMMPEVAEAFSEKEQYQFGLVFIPFFLVFYVAALVRMFTLGKL